jgi:serine/threonine protein kinase
MLNYQAKLGEYILGKKLGSGQFSKVRVGTKEGVNYAVKYMTTSSDIFENKTFRNLAFNEAKIMLQLDHPNIVHLYDFSDKGVIEKASGKMLPVLYLIFELVTGGELFDYIAVGGCFTDPVARFYFKQLIEALTHLYSKGFVHRDIKAENIMMDDKCNLKLGDFGFATAAQGKEGDGKLNSQKGTLGYMAPEIIIAKPYTGEKVDLFAAGVLLFTMLAQHPPFRKASGHDGFFKLFCQQNETFWKKMGESKPAGTFSESLKSLINGMLELNPVKRFGMAEIKAHPWFNEPTPTLEEVQADIRNRRAAIETEWRKNAEAAALKKKIKMEKKAEEEKKAGAYGGLTPHLPTKAGAIAESLEPPRIIKDYKVR